MDDRELLAHIEQEEAVAYGMNDAELSNQRAQAMRYYLGEPFGNEVEGRSQVVSYDVQDTVEASLPQLIKIFTAGDQVVKFDPRNPQDEAGAAQETDYINYLVMERNNGFEMLYCWFKDALISKNGYVKAYFEEEEDTEEEQYKGVTDAQLQMLAQGEGIKVLEHTAYPDPDMQQQYQQGIQMYHQAAAAAQQAGGPPPPPLPPQPMLHDVKISVTEKRGCIRVKNVAPESIMISVDTPGLKLDNARFVQHREHMSPEEAREAGFKVPDNADFAERDYFQQESNARDLYAEQFGRMSDLADEILVKDTYLRVDGKRRRVVVIGNTIVLNEPCSVVPFACISPMLMPHRHIGRSYSDLTMDIQLIKSALIRGQLDNMYLSNNGRYAISDRVNLEDMLTSRPGGVVRVEGTPGDAIFPLQHTPFPPTSFTMVEYLDTMKEKRTGVTAYNQGLDANSLNKTATGINAIMNAAAARLELVARVFAETGVKDLFLLVHRLVRMNYTKPDIVKLRGTWVDIDPREWQNRYDMSVDVGLGTGSKDQQLMHLQTIIGSQQAAIPMGLVTSQNLYNSLVKLAQNSGFKNPEEFYTAPKQPGAPPAAPPDPKIQVAQIQAQSDMQKTQLMAQGDQQKFQAQMQNDAWAAQHKAGLEQQIADRQMQNETQRSQNDMTLERERMQMQAQMEQFKANLEAETAIKIAVIDAQSKAAALAQQPRQGVQ